MLLKVNRIVHVALQTLTCADKCKYKQNVSIVLLLLAI